MRGKISFLFLFLLQLSFPILTPSQDVDNQQDTCRPPCNVGDRPACELTWAPHVNAVFLGKVVEVKEEEVPFILNGKPGSTVKLTATVKTEENFLGVESKIVTVVSGGDLCGFPFSKGIRYLIYAKRQREGTYYVTRCGGTKWADRANEDLKYLRRLASVSQTATVLGRVFRFDKRPDQTTGKALRTGNSWVGGKVVIKGESQTFTAVVDQNGSYQATGLPPGTYAVDIQVGEPTTVKTSSGFSRRDITGKGKDVVIHAKGCAQVDFEIDPFAKEQ